MVINRPENPLDFLIERLQKPETKRIFLVGPPGSNRKVTALALEEHFSWHCISVGDLLKKEIAKKSEFGKTIAECQKHYRYVPDEIVIDLVKTAVLQHEKENKSWIVEGFPRTKVQAMSL